MSLITEGADLARSAEAGARAEPSLADVGDYVALLKPRVMSLVIFTALVGLVVAPGHFHPVLGFVALLCIAIGAGAAGALNMWYDADIGLGDPNGRKFNGAVVDDGQGDSIPSGSGAAPEPGAADS